MQRRGTPWTGCQFITGLTRRQTTTNTRIHTSRQFGVANERRGKLENTEEARTGTATGNNINLHHCAAPTNRSDCTKRRMENAPAVNWHMIYITYQLCQRENWSEVFTCGTGAEVGSVEAGFMLEKGFFSTSSSVFLCCIYCMCATCPQHWKLY